MPHKNDHEVIKPSKELKKKVGNGGFSKDALKKASEDLEKIAPAFQEVAKKNLKELKEYLEEKSIHAPFTPEDYQKCFTIMHNLRGEGETSGYHLITDIAKSLCHYLENSQEKAFNIAIIIAHIDSMIAVLTHEMKGENLEMAQTIAKELKRISLSQKR